MTKDEKFMTLALKEAKRALDEDNWAIGCVIVEGNDVLVKAHNQTFSNRDRLAHAEIRAINQLNGLDFDKDKELVLYTTYEPCIMCYGAILLSGIKKVVAGVDLDDSGPSSFIDHTPRQFRSDFFKTDYQTGVLEKECAEMWLQSRLAKRMIKKGYKLNSNYKRLVQG